MMLTFSKNNPIQFLKNNPLLCLVMLIAVVVIICLAGLGFTLWTNSVLFVLTQALTGLATAKAFFT